MKKRMLPLLLAALLCLTGCGSFLEREWYEVKDHSSSYYEGSGRTYQGVSHIVFDLGDEWYTEFLKFTLPVFLTFNQVKEEEVNITRAYLQIKVNHYPSYVRIVSLS